MDGLFKLTKFSSTPIEKKYQVLKIKNSKILKLSSTHFLSLLQDLYFIPLLPRYAT